VTHDMQQAARVSTRPSDERTEAYVTGRFG
jgi:hypothetical protein